MSVHFFSSKIFFSCDIHTTLFIDRFKKKISAKIKNSLIFSQTKKYINFIKNDKKIKKQ